MMSEKEFTESQKECATMLGMSLSEYEKYCKNLKVPKQENACESEKVGNTDKFLKILGVDKSLLKNRKEN